MRSDVTYTHVLARGVHTRVGQKRSWVEMCRASYDDGMSSELVVYVDIDDTLVRSAGTKRIPMLAVLDRVRELAASGAELYAWSSGGSDYALHSARELGVEALFRAFLPKPHVMIDDQPASDWKRLIYVHPNEVAGRTAADLRASYQRPG